MKKILTRYFNSWWLPALVYLFLLGIYAGLVFLSLFLGGYTGGAIDGWILVDVFFCMAGLAFMGLISAMIWNFVKKRWNKGAFNLFLAFISGIVSAYVFMFTFLLMPPEDGFADDLQIPAGIEITEPGEELKVNADEEQSGDIKQEIPSLELRKSFQPGIYDSVIWVNPGEPGILYLKVFEITKGKPLSVGRLPSGSVDWSDDPEELFCSKAHFTIYEGDWGKPYAARFEVWFLPDSGKPERKLLEKIFKIEGWQR